MQPFQNLPAASQVDPRRLFPRPSARDCPTNGASRMSPRANRRETRRDGAHRRSAVRAAHHTARRHAPSPRPRRDPHVHPRQDETTPASEHTAARRVLRTSRRPMLGHQTAEPIHWCTRLHPSPHPAPARLQPPCAGARPRRSARLSRVLSERLGRASWFASFKNSRPRCYTRPC